MRDVARKFSHEEPRNLLPDIVNATRLYVYSKCIPCEQENSYRIYTGKIPRDAIARAPRCLPKARSPLSSSPQDEQVLSTVQQPVRGKGWKILNRVCLVVNELNRPPVSPLFLYFSPPPSFSPSYFLRLFLSYSPLCKPDEDPKAFAFPGITRASRDSFAIPRHHQDNQEIVARSGERPGRILYMYLNIIHSEFFNKNNISAI